MKILRYSGAYGTRLNVAVGVCVAVSLCLGLVSRGFGQGTGRPAATKFYPDFSDEADNLLRNAANHARDGQWGEAIEIYQRVIQQFGEKVARLPRDLAEKDPNVDSTLYVDIRQFCQRKLASLPPEGRAIYRSRVDPQAERWFLQGQANRDRTLLRRVVTQAFCSSRGDDALDLIGDLAFQDGRFDEALAAYRQIVPDRIDDTTALVYPDPSLDVAKVAAKKILCVAAIGENPPTRADLETYKTNYPDAQGKLAGRDQSYLQTLIDALRDDKLTPPSQPDGRWPTFAGAPTRTRLVPGGVDVGSLQWRVDLDPIAPGHVRGRRGRLEPIVNGVSPERLLGYHPIVIRDQVIVANDGQISAYNLNDRPEGPAGSPAGVVKVAWQHDEDQGAFVPQAARPTVGIPRFTLTAFGNRLYARMGQTALPYIGPRGGIVAQNYLVALDLGTDGKLLWKKQAGDVLTNRRGAEAASRNLGFEGTPVADAKHVYVAMSDRREQTSIYVVCLDADNGTTLWTRYLGAASADGDMIFGMGGMMGMGGMGGGATFSGDYGHRLLSLDGPTVYFQTNLGAVAAVDAESGSIRWVATYPRQEKNGPTSRDLNPAIVHDGLVIVAPDDASSIYAFEASGGRLVWKTEPLPEEVKLAHLLGVAKGKLVATGDRVLLFDVKTGKLQHSWPDNGHNLQGFGRGLLAGDKIYWPTHNEIHVLDQSNGLRSEPPIKLLESFQTTGGNLAVGDGFLIVAQSDRLVVFCQNRRLIQRFREEIARAPDQAIPYYQLAKAAEATGQDDVALEALGSALAKVKASEVFDGVPLQITATDQKFRLLMKLGSTARGEGKLEVAESRFVAASSTARTNRDRLRSKLARAEIQDQRGEPGKAVDTLQGLLLEPELRGINVSLEDGRRSIRSELLIGDRLSTLLKAHGRKLYASFDQEAKALFEKGREAADPRQLEQVSRSFPVAEIVPDSLLALGRLYQSKKQPALAARAFKRLLSASADDAHRARALLGAAQAFKDQKLLVSARDAFAEALVRFPMIEVEAEDQGTTIRVATIAAKNLGEPPLDRMANDRLDPKVPMPLGRSWQKRLDPIVRPVVAEGTPPSPDASRVFLVRKNTVRPVVLSGGDAPWNFDLETNPVWVGFLDDCVVLASERRIVALEVSRGTKLWSFESGMAVAGQSGPNPFARPEAAPKPTGEPKGALHGFRVVGDRIFCLRGEKELLAIAGDSGQVDWSYTPSQGTINPMLWVGTSHIVLQTLRPETTDSTGGGLTVVLDTEQGRRIGEYPRPEGQDLKWERPPLPLDDDRVALVIDRRTVALFDLTKGVDSWVFRESEEMPKFGPPRLFGDAERLLMLQDGTDLIRLDAATGKKRWSRPLGSENLSDRPESIAFDADRVYWTNGANLNAARIQDGSLSWTRSLAGPNHGWTVELTDRNVMAFPIEPKRTATGTELEGLPLVFCRRESGELVQRLLFTVSVSDIAVRLAPSGAVIATPSRLWALGARRSVDAPGSGR